MRVSIVAAASANNVIGRDGRLPWHISEDLRHFKALTLGHPVIMGRLTWESIGRPLPGRQNIVITSQADFGADGCIVVTSPAEALRAAGDVDEVMVIGGGQIYELFLPITTRIYLTRVEAEIDGDTFFPALDPDEWRLVASETYARDEDREYGFSFQTLERIPAAQAGGGR
jgi:dihydrofolate reductase